MHTTARIRRIVGLAIATIAGIVVPLASAPSPAGAADVTLYQGVTNAVTWVDGSGRQLAATTMVGPDLTLRLIVVRDTPQGVPDTTWGANGVRTITPVAPASGLDRLALLTASGTGQLTLVWKPTSCTSATATCTLWTSRVDAAGAEAAPSASFSTDQRPWRGLPDGSLLFAGADGSLRWRGADGADRGGLAATTTTLVDAAVDGTGRLLVTTTDGTVTRRAPGQPADLTLPSSCPTTQGFAVTGAADDGFAVACGSATASSLAVTRHEPDGSIRWSATAAGAPRAPSSTTHLALDSTDRAFVGGEADLDVGGTGNLRTVVVTPVAATGAQTNAYERPKLRPGNYDVAGSGLDELRPGTAGRVVIADLQRCCFGLAGTRPADSLHAVALPEVPSPPTCAPAVEAIGVSNTAVQVTVHPCSVGPNGTEPEGYRIDASGAAGSTTVSVVDERAPITVTLAPLLAGRHLQLTVTSTNDVGDGAATTLHTVSPFRATSAFVDHLFETQLGRLPTAQESTFWIGRVNSEVVTPEEVADTVLNNGYAGQLVVPVVNVYRAAFLRDPDLSGLTHWVAKRRSGSSLRSVAAAFAASSEFRSRYGRLSNEGFVRQVYRNTFGREVDPSGLAFWTGRLDRGVETRASVMLKLPISVEYVEANDTIVEPIAAVFSLVHRLPTPAERVAWQTPTFSTWATVARDVFASQAWVDQVLAG